MEKIKMVAARIKTLREIAGKSIPDTAKMLEVTDEQYSKYENGQSDIPISFLYAASRVFNVELTAILTGEEPRLHRYSVVRKGTGPSVERKKEYTYSDLAYNFIHKKMEVFEVKAGQTMPKTLNKHTGQEFNFILEGTLKIIIENNEIILNEGDSIFFDSGHAHAMCATGGRDARFLAVII